MQSGPKEQEWPDGTWMYITKEEYEVTRPDYNVIIKGKIAKPLPIDAAWVQLEKADDGPFTSLKDNIIFAAEEGDKYKMKDYYALFDNRDEIL